MSFHRTYVLLLLSTLICVGCGSRSERAVVFGKVTYDGKIVGDGQIAFIPKTGTKAPRGGSRIVHGEYRVASRGGLLLGEYTVRIEGFELAEGAEPPPAVISFDTIRGKQYLPEKYNSHSELKFTLEATGDLEQNFDLSK